MVKVSPASGYQKNPRKDVEELLRRLFEVENVLKVKDSMDYGRNS